MAYDLTNFDAELAAVDGARSFTQSINPAWGENEWSVSGYAITAGSDTAVQHAASEALYQLGFRFWTPTKTTRPASLPAGGVTLARQEFLYPHINIFYNYAYGGVEGTQVHADFNRLAEMLCWNDSRRPVGHAYPSIINAIEADDGFFTANPTYMTGTVGSAANSFNLALTGADRTALINRVAAHIVPNLNEQKRHSIDPNDGSTWTSDQVFGFANDVAAVVAQTEPDVMLGLYGYAGHRTPVTFQCPRLYVDLARGFNDLGIGYLAIGKLWAQVLPEFGLRAYGDVGAWSGFMSHIGGGYVNDYVEHAADGAVGISMETSANWTKNVIVKQHWFRHWRDGTTSYQDVLSDAVDKLYDGDSRVADLFNYWSTSSDASRTAGLVHAADIVDAMPDTEYRAEFKRYLTFAMTHDKLTGNTVDAHGGPYFTILERNLRHTKSLELSQEIHHNVYARRMANSNTNDNGRPDLSFNANGHWSRYPRSYNDDDFDAALVDSRRQLPDRPEELDDTRLVVVDTQPWEGASVTEAASFVSEGGLSTYVFVGPGTVTIDYLGTDDDDDVLTFGVGLHELTAFGYIRVTWSNGLLFRVLSERQRMDVDTNNPSIPRWAYVPKLVKGKSVVRSGSRMVFYNNVDTFTVVEEKPPFSSGAIDPRTLPSGVLAVSGSTTRGFHTLLNINPYISATPYKMLMPFALAQREFPSMTFNGTGQVPTVLDLSDDTDGQSEDTED